MNTDRETDGFGNFSLFILAAIFLSLLAYQAFNAPNGGNLPESIRHQYGANKDNLIGALTSNFLHDSPQHIINNLSLAILLVFFAMFLEKEMPGMKGANPFAWVLLPAAAAVLANIPVHAFFGISPYAVGMSVMIYYLVAFFVWAGKDAITASALSAIHAYWEMLTGKALIPFSSRLVLQILLFFFLGSLLLLAASGMLDGVNRAGCIQKTNDAQKCNEQFITGIAHYSGFVMGFVFGLLWNRIYRKK